MIGRTLSSYRVVEKLGGGGMGEVYLARDERLGRDVALKILPEGRLRDESARSRFRKEAQALLRLSHPHVATLLDFGSADGTVSCVGLRGQAADLRRAEHLEVDVGVVALLSTLRRKPSAAERQGEEG